MMSFLLHTEPAGKMKGIFGGAGQDEVALLRPGVIRNRWNMSKEIPVPHGHSLYGKGKSKSMPWDESEMQTKNQLFIS